MENEIRIIDSKELGLEKAKAHEIEQSFYPIKSEIDGLSEIYSRLVQTEITDSLVMEAKEFYTTLKKVNGSNNRIHKSQKAYFLAGGKWADALKNKNRDILDVMKERALEIINYAEKKESLRIENLNEERINEITPFLHPESIAPTNLGIMELDVWESYLFGKKERFRARMAGLKAAESERIEADKLAETERIATEKRNEEIRIENERLKKEAEKKEAERLVELKKIKDEQIKKEAEEKAKADELAAKLKAKEEAEIKAKADEELRIRAELSKGDEAKINDLISDLEALISKYSFKSKKNQSKYKSVGTLINKVVTYIKQ